MNWQHVVWTYIALLVVGGAIGYVKAGSKISLIASVAFAVPLVLALLLRWRTDVSVVVLGIHFVYFAARFVRTKKLMPGGLLAAASLATGLFAFFATR